MWRKAAGTVVVSIFTKRGRGIARMSSGHSVYQLSFDPGTHRLRSNNTKLRAASFQFNLSFDGFRWPVQTAIVPIYWRQAAKTAVNLYRRLARSKFLSYISFDSLVLEF